MLCVDSAVPFGPPPGDGTAAGAGSRMNELHGSHRWLSERFEGLAPTVKARISSPTSTKGAAAGGGGRMGCTDHNVARI